MEIGPIPWTSNFAYGIGLLATDGWISTLRNGYPSIGFASKDIELIDHFRRCLDVKAKPRVRTREKWGRVWTSYEVGFSSVRLAHWLKEIGITPRKSRTIGALAIPDEFLLDTVRGLLDGDGSVARFTNGRGRHVFSLQFFSASKAHLLWLSDRLKDRLRVTGHVATMSRSKGLSKNPIYKLGYGNDASRTLASAIYSDPLAPALDRKRIRWLAEEASGRF